MTKTAKMLVGLHSCGGGRQYTGTLLVNYTAQYVMARREVKQGREIRSVREARFGPWLGRSAAVKPWACRFFSLPVALLGIPVSQDSCGLSEIAHIKWAVLGLALGERPVKSAVRRGLSPLSPGPIPVRPVNFGPS